MTDKEKLEAIRAEIHRLVDVRGYDREMANDLFAFMDSLPNESVSEDLEKAGKEWLTPQLDKSYADYGETKMMELTRFDGYAILDAIEFGAQWQKEHLWKTADGENLSELERDVVVLIDNFGKLIPKLAKRTYHLIENFVDEDTGEIISMEHTDKVGDVINWTEPAIYWLDVDLPKLQED